MKKLIFVTVLFAIGFAGEAFAVSQKECAKKLGKGDRTDYDRCMEDLREKSGEAVDKTKKGAQDLMKRLWRR